MSHFPQFVLFTLSALLLTSACTVGPNYKSPNLITPTKWSYQDPAYVIEPQQQAAWWNSFNDPTLEYLIKEASQGNLDQKIALTRLDEYRLHLAMARGEHLPSLSMSAGASRQKSSAVNFTPGTTNNLFSLGGDFSWEVDLFGRIRRAVEAANADLQAEQENYHDILVSLYANVASRYFEFRTLQEREEILLKNLKALQQVIELAEARAKHGLGSDLEVAQTKRLYAASKSELPLIKAAKVRTQNALAILLGKTEDQIAIWEAAYNPSFPSSLAIGFPADLIRQRPDIRKSERLLAAQTARIGMATAQLYPNLSIGALIGRDALRSGDLFKSGSGSWSLGVSIGQSLFNRGQLRNQVKLEDTRAQRALLHYEQTVLRALAEVETAMSYYVEKKNQSLALEEALEAAKRSVSSSNTLYLEGLVDFQNVLDAQRQQLEIEDRWVQANGDQAIGLVQLYRALGGGWDQVTQTALNDQKKSGEN